MVVQRRRRALRSATRARRRCLRERWRNSFCRMARVCDRVGGYGLGTMVVISGLYAGTGLCGLGGGRGCIGGGLRTTGGGCLLFGPGEGAWLQHTTGTDER